MQVIIWGNLACGWAVDKRLTECLKNDKFNTLLMNTFFTFLSKKTTQLAGLFTGARLKIRGILSLNMPKLRLKEGFLKKPSFYFAFSSFALLTLLFFSSGALAKLQYAQGSQSVFFNSFFETTNLENHWLWKLRI